MNNEIQPNTSEDIIAVCNQVADMLVKKNQSYGDSALTPAHIFSRLDSIEGIKIRIDDKLNRLRLGNGNAFHEDVELDLMGYLVLLRIARLRKQQEDDERNLIGEGAARLMTNSK